MSKKYQVIYADPPWQQSKGGLRKARPNQGRELDYPVISLTEIEAHMRGFTQESPSVLFLWTIDKFLHEAEELGNRLGYKLHARMVWNKGNGIAPAFTVRFAHEYLLWMYKSPFIPIAKEMRGKYLTVFEEKATVHSRKPQTAYEMIEALYPDASKVELYARIKRGGWDSWGNEVSCLSGLGLPTVSESGIVPGSETTP